MFIVLEQITNLTNQTNTEHKMDVKKTMIGFKLLYIIIKHTIKKKIN